jgi:PTH2 family peptidyl-tRNA hydrolase
MSAEQTIVVVIRKDLGMRPGKVAAQTAHALCGAAPTYTRCTVYKVHSKQELRELYFGARHVGLWAHLQVDAGHTQVEPNTMTAVAFGPTADVEILKELTQHLKLF